MRKIKNMKFGNNFLTKSFSLVSSLLILFGFCIANGSQQELWVPMVNGFQAEMWFIEDGAPVGSPLPVVIGKKGFAEVDKKREGDKKTPQGVYPLEMLFGKAPSFLTNLPYVVLTPDDKWIDDPQSEFYNQWVRGETSAKSYETLLRRDGIYDFILVVGYNRQPIIPFWGSAIFMHIWSSPLQGTEGCIAMSKNNLLKVLNWLDIKKNPVIRLGSQNAIINERTGL